MNRIILFLTLLSNLITISVTFTVSSPRQAFPLCINQRTTKQQQRQQCPFSPSISSPVRDIEVNSKILPPMLMSSAVANMDDENNEVSSGGTATMSNLMFNLVKSIVGAGVLSLPSGIAAFASAPSAVIPAVCLISSMGIASSYMFSLIGRVCSYTGATSYREAWDKSISPKTSWIAAGACTSKTLLATIAYSMILGDTFQALFQTLLGKQFARSSVILGITGTCLLPLCLLKDLASLAPFSLLGIIGMIYTTFAMALRYFSPFYKLPDGALLADVATHLQPSFGSIGASGIASPNAFILICMLSTAFIAHFNAPKFYTELKDNTIKRFNTLVYSSFAVSISIFASVASLGFLTFGQASSGLILNNYSTKDMIMTISRIAVATSLIFSYPLAFTGARDGILDLANVPPSDRSNSLLNKVTFGALAAVTAVALKIKDLTFLLSFGGATLGNALIYIFPAFMFRGAVNKMKDETKAKGLKKEVGLSLLLAAVGAIMGGIGTRMAIGTLN